MFNTEWAGIEVSYFGASDTEGERIKVPKMLGLETFIKEYDDLKKDNIDPPALLIPRKQRGFLGLRKGSL